ncbi:Carbohydrate kinase, FGGY [Cordyceps fumosorosea ARSEF 2679]|uniref:Xylulose kinase n=1 Tax=Cordyceps fumosorosea (strain ARSEF 2679) TaxID=1081104 RepID=A0A167LRK7_CORFA|nr:Carbohydrate kinase, FGGY [Cordyceps fumosorosea ARSEF 2679]OAA53411.1 Carbohydrate kinase, FGGY [Cordyceps fumosorosea ARSEF 2679]
MVAADDGPLYLGLDLSTQQLKGIPTSLLRFTLTISERNPCSHLLAIIVGPDLKAVARAHVDFDADFGPSYGITKGVRTRPSTGEVYAPVALWLESLDLVLHRLTTAGASLHRVRGVSGAGQQHGSVYWAADAARALATLDPARPLVTQLAGEDVLAHPWSPNWQDHSTQAECDAFDGALGGRDRLAEVTGSGAHHRFTGPQIMRLRRVHPDVYARTARISLVSSWLASVLLGRIAPIDASDACGMNLWDMSSARWHPDLLSLAAGDSVAASRLRAMLGEPCLDAARPLGPVAGYFAARHGLRADCQVLPFTGDNPATLLALPLRPGDAIISLGTSTTFLMHTETAAPDADHHYFNHPTTPGHYMFMLCYKNGGLARERVRDDLPGAADGSWAAFDRAIAETPPLDIQGGRAKMGLYFDLRETVPNLRAGTWRFTCAAADGSDLRVAEAWPAATDARLIVESQALGGRRRVRAGRRAQGPVGSGAARRADGG